MRCGIGKKLMSALKALFGKIWFRIKLSMMDQEYYLFGGACFSFYPPSFYYTHTPEEIEEITNREVEEIRKLLDEL